MDATLLILLILFLLIVVLLGLALALWLRVRALPGPEVSVALAALRDSAGLQAGQLRGELGSQRQELAQALTEQRAALAAMREALDARFLALSRTLADGAMLARQEQQTQLAAHADQQRRTLTDMAERLDRLGASLREDAALQRKTLETRVLELQASNEKRLEEMRATVDEKLQKTLETRLGESFQLVSARLEAVQQGLGEMKVLADGVGDLKRVMANVKTRGTWGEVQLRALMEDILRPEEFVRNFAPRGSGTHVEFAVRLPGLVDDAPLYLPIDAKFPIEDYSRLLDAQEQGDVAAAAAAGHALEARIKACAREIAEKYIVPGKTTEFAILFLPLEGLYAEVLRRPGLAEWLQREHRVAVAGPTTLGAMLHSLRMGFSAVAIQKRSGDVGRLLGTVKHEFAKFGGVIDKVSDRLRLAQDDIAQVGVRTRAIERKLGAVEAVTSGAEELLFDTDV